jgi:hypothetical protein
MISRLSKFGSIGSKIANQKEFTDFINNSKCEDFQGHVARKHKLQEKSAQPKNF